MIARTSRYAGSRRFEADSSGTTPFKGVRSRSISTATPVVEHAHAPDERFDQLGVHYYNDSQLWWRILDANADILCAAEIEMIGLQPLPRSDGNEEAGSPAGAGNESAEPVADASGAAQVILLIPRASEGRS